MSNPAEIYESYMVPALFGPWAGRLVELTDFGQLDRVLDAGCGTGAVARKIAARNVRSGVVGLDASANMLEVARTAAQREGAVVEWRQGVVEVLPFENVSFEVVLSQFAMMFFSDRSAALREFHRVLVPGGRVAISVFQHLDRHPFYRLLHEAIVKRLGNSGVKDIFSLGERDALQSLLAEAGFVELTVEPLSMISRFPGPDAFLDGEIAVDTAAIPSMQHLDDEARKKLVAEIRDEMEMPLREATTGDHVSLPFHVFVARGRKPH